jgi:hypothetical protein
VPGVGGLIQSSQSAVISVSCSSMGLLLGVLKYGVVEVREWDG